MKDMCPATKGGKKMPKIAIVVIAKPKKKTKK